MAQFNAPDLDVFGLNPRIERMRQSLSDLPKNHQVAFAAQVSERLAGSYQKLTGFLGSKDGMKYRQILDRLWRHIAGEPLTSHEILNLLDVCWGLDLGEEGCCSDWNAGIDAVDALMDSLQACHHYSAEFAALAGENATNRIDRELFQQFAALHNEPIDPDRSHSINEEIEKHPLMVTEVNTQIQTVEFLRQHAVLGEVELMQLKGIGSPP